MDLRALLDQARQTFAPKVNESTSSQKLRKGMPKAKGMPYPAVSVGKQTPADGVNAQITTDPQGNIDPITRRPRNVSPLRADMLMYGQQLQPQGNFVRQAGAETQDYGANRIQNADDMQGLSKFSTHYNIPNMARNYDIRTYRAPRLEPMLPFPDMSYQEFMNPNRPF